MQLGNLKPYSVLTHVALLSRSANVSSVWSFGGLVVWSFWGVGRLVVWATDSSLATGLAVFEPHPDRRNRANKNDNVCFMATKVAIPPELLLSSIVKDFETTEKSESV